MTTRLHLLQHVPFEDLAFIGRFAEEHGFTVTSTALYKGEQFPDAGSFDWLIITGGPMGVNNEQRYPWLIPEKKCIENAIATHKVVLGICLGAQLIASVLGAEVRKNTHKEIGWFPVYKIHEFGSDPLPGCFPETCIPFHWHGDTFDIPEQAVHFYKSEACENQAFLYTDRVIAFQFHLEATRESITSMIDNCNDELVKGKYIQSSEEIVSRSGSALKAANAVMKNILETLRTIQIHNDLET